MVQILVILLIGYFLGSLPTAYFVVRWKLHQDIRKLDSGNVGAFNCYIVTGSKVLGLTVLCVDVAKTVLALLIVKGTFGADFWSLGMCGIAAVGGHNFPVWLRFHGGRGLAASAGVMLLLGWALMPLWIALWLMAYWKTRDILLGNGWATLVTPIVLLVVPSSAVAIASTYSIPVADFMIFVALLSGIVLLKHVKPIVANLKGRRAQRVELS
ncbi:MAG: glycerol-3-phosphate acyltransferase [Bacteroidota bacterium]